MALVQSFSASSNLQKTFLHLYKLFLLNNRKVLWGNTVSAVAQTSPASGRPWLCLQEGGRSWHQLWFLGYNTPQLLHIFPLWNKRCPAGKSHQLQKHTFNVNEDGFDNRSEGFQHQKKKWHIHRLKRWLKVSLCAPWEVVEPSMGNSPENVHVRISMFNLDNLPLFRPLRKKFSKLCYILMPRSDRVNLKNEKDYN